jgi:hypothetical protein
MIEEYPQTIPNLTAATNLFDLISRGSWCCTRRWHEVCGLARHYRQRREAGGSTR